MKLIRIKYILLRYSSTRMFMGKNKNNLKKVNSFKFNNTLVITFGYHKLTVAARCHNGRVIARRSETAAIIPWVFDFDNVHGWHAVWILNYWRCKKKKKCLLYYFNVNKSVCHSIIMIKTVMKHKITLDYYNNFLFWMKRRHSAMIIAIILL